MIETKKGTTKFEGDTSEIMADVSIIIFAVKKAFTEEFGDGLATELLNTAVKQGMMEKEEVLKKVKEELEDADASTLVKILKEVLKDE